MQFTTKFDEFLESGFLSPFSEGMTREQIVEYLGEPEEWLGKEQGFNWRSRPIPWEQSLALIYGSVHFSFSQEILVGCSVSYYDKPLELPPMLSYLPNEIFTFKELCSHLTDRGISYMDLRKDKNDDTMLITEGLVHMGTWHMDKSDKAKIIGMFSNRGGAISSVLIYGGLKNMVEYKGR